jgi:hypothetical protein
MGLASGPGCRISFEELLQLIYRYHRVNLQVEKVQRWGKQIEDLLRRIYIENNEPPAGIRENAVRYQLAGLKDLLQRAAGNLPDHHYLLAIDDRVLNFISDKDLHMSSFLPLSLLADVNAPA